MNSFFNNMQEKWEEIRNDPKRRKVLLIIIVVTAIILCLVFLYFLLFPAVKRNVTDKGDTITEGYSADINYDVIIGYDADGNPIFGSYGMDPSIIGYDIYGNPITIADIGILGYDADGNPIYDFTSYHAVDKGVLGGEGGRKMELVLSRKERREKMARMGLRESMAHQGLP